MTTIAGVGSDCVFEGSKSLCTIPSEVDFLNRSILCL